MKPLCTFDEVEKAVAECIKAAPTVETRDRSKGLRERILVALLSAGQRGLTSREIQRVIRSTTGARHTAALQKEGRIEDAGHWSYRLTPEEAKVQVEARKRRAVKL